jgi:O-antigen ligase
MQRALEIILTLVMIGMALAFGGVLPYAYSVGEIILFVAMLLWLYKRSGEERLGLKQPLWPVLFLLLVVLQIVPLPRGVVATLSPKRLLDPAVAGVVGIDSGWTTLSIYPHDTILVGIRMLGYLCAFLLAAHLYDSRMRKSTLVIGLVGLGSFEAGYGIFQYLTGWQKIFTYTKRDYTNLATGTYINHDHFAGLLELTIPFAFASAFYFFQLWSEDRPRNRRGSSTQSAVGLQAVFYLFLVALMVIGVGFSISRGGILGTIASIMFVALLALTRLKRGRKTWLVGVFLLLTCIVSYALWIGLGAVLTRFQQVHEANYLQMEGRIATWRDSLLLIRDYPLVGTGLGTFGLAFRHYQTAMVNYYFAHTHNDYLEFASDTGLLGAMILFLPILYLLVRMLLAFVADSRRYRRAVLLGCIGSTLGILIHSAMDFNLQIPANALVFAVVLGIGYKAACLEPRADNAVPPRAGVQTGSRVAVVSGKS